MLSFHLRFAFPFVSIIHSLAAEQLAPRNQCHSSWHYLSEKSLCVIFATSQAGDVPWTDGHQACQTNSAQLLTLPDRSKLQSVRQKLYQLETARLIDEDYLERGAWIGKAKWSNNDLCDGFDTTAEDLQWNCLVLTRRSHDGSLCVQRASCLETHPFICESTALTDKEYIESTMERLTWWKCIILVWCIVDDQKQKKEKEAQLAKQKAELESYISQFNFDIPDDPQSETNAIPSAQSDDENLKLFGFVVPQWIILAIGAVILLFMLCICCTVMVCICVLCKRRRARQSPAFRDGSFESSYSTVSK